MSELHTPDYGYRDAIDGHPHAYLLPTLDRILQNIKANRVDDFGCGNGS